MSTPELIEVTQATLNKARGLLAAELDAHGVKLVDQHESAGLVAGIAIRAIAKAIEATGVREAIEREEKEHEATIEQRDRAQDAADRLAHLIGQLTGTEIGEHSNLNCPWANAEEAVRSGGTVMRQDKGDLVERLREVEWSGKSEGKPVEFDTTCWMRNPDGPEAADRIEALEAAVAEVRCKASIVINGGGDEGGWWQRLIDELDTALTQGEQKDGR